MKNKFSILRIIFLSIFLYCSVVHSQDVGATFAWQYQEIYGGHRAYPNNNSIVTDNLPFLDPIPEGDRGDWHRMRQWWENMAEEINYSGLDYVALLSRGDQKPTRPDNGNGNPVHIQKLVTAMTTRGADNFKLAIFDDCPNSWTASRNYFLTGVVSTSPPLDCGDAENYKYIWDMNLKEAIAAIPDEKRYKINGRMVIFFWSVKTTWMTNITGNLSKILAHIRTECTKEFGFNPYLVVDGDWFSQDVLLKDSDVDAEHGWFSSANGISHTLRTRNNTKIGALVPGFGSAGESTFLDPSMGTSDNGKRLKMGLDNTVKQGARTTLLEGFTDSAESAALWRSEDNVYYDYPNQRLNIIRSYTSNPYPIYLKMEAEACDFYNDLTAANTGGKFLKSGSLDVVDCTDINIGWNVTNTQAGEWMEWRELPLVPENKFEIRYKSTAAASVYISIDGMAQPTVTLPATSNVWTTINAGNYVNGNNSAHTVRLTVASGSPDINYFTRTNLNTGPVSVTSVAVTPTAATIIKTKTLKLEASVTPAYATNSKVTWTSSNPSIATVDAFGLVTGINIGSATITVTTEDGAKTASSAISIENPTTMITLQAEDAVFSGPKVATNNAGYNGTGFLDYTNATGDFIKWTVNVPNTGEYELSFRYALPSGNRPLELKVNEIVVVPSLAFLATGAWTTWQNVVTKQMLNAGSNQIQLTSIGSNGANFDELVVTNTVNLGTNTFDVQNQKTVNIYPNPFKEGVLKIDLSGFESSKDITVTLINLTGQTIYKTTTPYSEQIEINLSKNLNESLYFVSIASGDTQIIKKLMVK